MNYGLYLSASGVLTNLYRQDVFANNLANVETVGFKPAVPATRQRDPEAIEDGLGPDLSHDLLDLLTGGVYAGPQRVNMAPGPLTPTGNGLDAALADSNSFFTVRHTDPITGAVSTRLTRDGRFAVGPEGQIVTQAGHAVLKRNGDPIVVGPGGPPEIGRHGRVLQDGEQVARLRITRVDDTAQLERHEQNLFTLPAGAAATFPDEPDVKFGFTEGSGADPVRTLMSLIDATKAAMGNARMIQYHDMLMDKAVNTLGRVA